MNPSTSLRSLALTASLLALALPVTSHAQGNSANTPAAEHRQNEEHSNNGHGNSNGVAPVPEPATWVAMASLVAVGALFARRQFKQAGHHAA